MSNLSTTTRFVDTHYADDLPGPRYIPTIEDALRNGVAVTFFMCRGDARPMFRLRAYRGVVHVVDPKDRHLGTFADTSAAVDWGWQVGALPWINERGGVETERKRVRRRKAG
jgi:hypothetical protein